MSKLGGATAFVAEAGLWVAGAALIASAAGMHWKVDTSMINLNGLTSAQSSSGPSAGGAPTFAFRTLAPGAVPTASPLVAKYQAYVARADYQIVAKYTNIQTGVIDGKQREMRVSGTAAYQGGNHSDFSRVTQDGAVITDDVIALGGFKYESINGAAWTKTARTASDAASDRLIFAPAALFLDSGVETKNGLPLHRLDIADPVAFSTALVKTSTSGLTGAQATYTTWVDDAGVPAAIRVEGVFQGPIGSTSTSVTIVQEFRIIATSGVSITAPI